MDLSSITEINGCAFRMNKFDKVSFPNLKTLVGEEIFSNNQNLKYVDVGKVENLVSKIVNGCNNLQKFYIKSKKNLTDETDIRNVENSSDINAASLNVRIYVRNRNLKNILNEDLNTFIKNHNKDNIIYQEPLYTSEHSIDEIKTALSQNNQYYKIVDDADILKDCEDISFKNSNEDIEYIDLSDSTLIGIPSEYFKGSNAQYIKLSKSMARIYDSAFDNAANLREIELTRETETTFDKNSTGLNKNIKIIVSSTEDYKKLSTSMTEFINPHKTKYVKLHKKYIIPETNYNITEIKTILNSETEWNEIVDEFGVLDKLVKAGSINKISEFPNNITKINIRNLPFNSLFNWNNITHVILKGTNLTVPTFKESKIIYVDLSKASFLNNQFPDEFFMNCYDLEYLKINDLVENLGTDTFKNDYEFLKIVIQVIERIYVTTETTTIKDIENVLKNPEFYEEIDDSIGIIEKSGKTFSDIVTEKDSQIKNITIGNLTKSTTEKLFGSLINEDFTKITLKGSGILPTFTNNTHIQIIDIESFICSEIPENCFQGCSNLGMLFLNDSTINFKNNAFQGCGLKYINIMTPNQTIVNGNSGLYGAYIMCQDYNVDVLSVYFNNSFINISDQLIIKLTGEQTKEINIDTISKGEKFILDCSEVSGTLKIVRDQEQNNLLTELYLGKNITDIPLEKCFSKCVKLLKVILDKCFDSMCSECYSLENITINTDVNNNAFEKCYGITNLKLSNSVKRIGDNAFRDCHGIEILDIPSSVNYIGETAFSGCYGLNNVICLMTENSGKFSYSGANITRYEFNSTTNSSIIQEFKNMFGVDETIVYYGGVNPKIDMSKIYSNQIKLVPDLTNLPSGTLSSEGEGGNISLKLVEANLNGIDKISDNLFKDFKALKKIYISDNVTYIGENAFYGCVGLETVICKILKNSGYYTPTGNNVYDLSLNNAVDETVSKNIKFMFGYKESEVSEHPDLLTVYYDSENVEFTDDYSCDVILKPKPNTIFSGTMNISYTNESIKNKLIEVEIANGIEMLNEKIFMDCHRLKGIQLPNSLTRISSRAFQNCFALSDINIPTRLNSLNDHVFHGCENIKNITIPDSLTSLGIGAFENCYGLEFVKLHSNINDNFIPGQCFEYCSNLRSINIPDGIKLISNFAFYQCCLLNSITIPSSVSNLASGAFENCYGLKNVVCLMTQNIDSYSSTGCQVSHLELNPEASEDVQNKFKTMFGYSEEGTQIIEYDSNTIDLTGNYTKDIILRPKQGSTFSGEFKINYGSGNAKQRLIDVEIASGFITIYYQVFYKCWCLQSVKIPNTITEIQNESFKYCYNLNSINIPNSTVRILNNAFEKCKSLKKIIIPNSVTSIGSYAFIDCDNLKDIIIDGDISRFGAGTFQNLHQLQQINIPTSLTEIASDCFSGCYNLESIEIPKSLTSINDNSFNYCYNLNNLTIDYNSPIKSQLLEQISPTNITEILYYSGVDPIIDISENYKNKLILKPDPVNKPSGKLTKTYNILSKLLIEIEIDGVNELEDELFKNCHKLSKLKISNSVNKIGVDCFSGCYVLKDVECLMTVNNGSYSETGTSAQKLVLNHDSNIKDNLADMFGNFFYSEVVYYSNSTIEFTETYDHNVILRPKPNTTFTGTMNITYTNESIKNKLVEVEVAEGINGLGGNLFQDCVKLSEVSLPKTLLTIESACFAHCYKLENIIIPNSVTFMEFTVFVDCYHLKHIELSDSMTSIGNNTFGNCYNLQSINIPSSVSVIEDEAFSYCHSMSSITIPSSITNIGTNAFEECQGIKNVDCSIIQNSGSYDSCSGCASHIIFGPNCSDDVKNNIKSMFGYSNEGVKTIYYGSNSIVLIDTYDQDIILKPMPGLGFSGTFNITKGGNILKRLIDVEIGEGFENISYSVFKNCYCLTSVKLPESLTSIENETFSNCYALKNVNIPNSVSNIGAFTFHNCNVLEKLNIPSSMSNINGIIRYSGENITSLTIPSSITRIETDEFANFYNLNNLYYEHNSPLKSDFITKYNSINLFEYISLNSENPTIDVSDIYGNDVIIYSNNSTGKLTKTGSPDNLSNRLIKADLDGISEIGDNVFENYHSLTELNISSTITKLGTDAFKNCVGLDKVDCQMIENTGSYSQCESYASLSLYDNISKDMQDNLLMMFKSAEIIEYTSEPTVVYYTSNNITLNDMDSKNIILKPDINSEISGILTITFEPDNVRNKLISVEISGVDRISENCFKNCYNLSDLTISNSVKNIGKNAFSGCYALKNVICMMTENNGFYSASGSHVDVLKLDETIDEEMKNKICVMFGYDSEISETIFYEGVNPIIDFTKYYNHNIILKASETNPPSGKLSSTNQIGNLNIKLISVEISGVDQISENCFKNCYNLSDLTISNSIKNIGENAFSGCYALKNVICMMTENNGFYSKTDGKANNLTLDETITTEMKNKFNLMFGYGGIKELVDYEKLVVYYDSNNIEFTNDYPCDVILKPKPNTTFSGTMNITYTSGNIKNKLVKVEIAEGITELGNSLFQECRNLKDINIPNSVKNIGEKSFYDCYSLKNIIIPDFVTDIGDYAFYYCCSLKDIQLSKTLTTLNNYVFGYCNTLKNFNIPNSIQNINSKAFWFCSSLENLTIPSSVTRLDRLVFSGCCGLKNAVCLMTQNSGSYDKTGYNVSHLEFNPEASEEVKNNIKTMFGYQEEGTQIIEYDSNTIDLSSNYTKDIILRPKQGVNFSGDFNINYGSGNINKRLIDVEIGNGFKNISSRLFEHYYYCLTNVKLPDTIISIGILSFYNCNNLNNINIPNTVTSIGVGAFKYCYNLNNINIPTNLTSINNSVFYDCYSLTKIIIPTTLFSIDDYAFNGCINLEFLEIPKSVTKLGTNVFKDCYNLNNLTIDYDSPIKSQLLEQISPTNITEILYYSGVDPIIDASQDYKNKIILRPDPVNKPSGKLTKIGDNLSKRLIEIEIDGVNELEDELFKNCHKLSKLKISKSVNKIGMNCFSNCYVLKDVECLMTVNNGSYSETGTSAQKLVLNYGSKINDNLANMFGNFFYFEVAYYDRSDFAFKLTYNHNIIVRPYPNTIFHGTMGIYYQSGNIKDKLVEVEVAKGITELNNNLFVECYNLKNIIIPDSVKIIGYQTFAGCSSLKNITLPSQLQKIDYRAFDSCYNIQKINIPDSITTIGSGAFRCCSLKDIRLPETLTVLNSSVFRECYLLTKLIIPNSIRSIMSSAFYNCYSLENLIIPSSVTELASGAFENCYGLKNVVCLMTQNSGSYSPIGCQVSHLELNPEASEEVKNNFKSMFGYQEEGTQIIEYDSNLIDLSDSYTKDIILKPKQGISFSGDFNINYGSGNAKIRLIDVEIGNGFENISNNVFENCYCLTNVKLPEIIINIESSAFKNCYKLKILNIPDTITYIENDAFNRCCNLSSINIPTNLTSINTGVFSYCYSLTKILIPNNIQCLEGYAFYNSYNIEFINFPSSITYLDNNAFANVKLNSDNIYIEHNSPIKSDIVSITNSNNTFEYISLSGENPTIDVSDIYGNDVIIYSNNSTGKLTKTGLLDNLSRLIKADLDGISEIGDNVFENYHSLTELNISSTVTKLGTDAFKNCVGLDKVDCQMIKNTGSYSQTGEEATNLTISNDATTDVKNNIIGMFKNIEIPQPDKNQIIYYSNSDPIIDFSISYENDIILLPDSTNIPNGILSSVGSENLRLTFVQISGVEQLSEGCFQNCYHLKQVIITSNINSIPNNCFKNCYELQTVEFNDSIKLIGVSAFENCYSLNISKLNLESIGDYAFKNCFKLNPENISSDKIGVDAFENCNSLKQLANSTYLNDGSFKNCCSIHDVNINNLTTISKNAFEQCYSLKNVNINESVEVISENAFKDCYSLKNLSIPSTVRILDNNAFENCYSMENVDCQIENNGSYYSEYGSNTKNITINNSTLYNEQQLIKNSFNNPEYITIYYSGVNPKIDFSKIYHKKVILLPDPINKPSGKLGKINDSGNLQNKLVKLVIDGINDIEDGLLDNCNYITEVECTLINITGQSNINCHINTLIINHNINSDSKTLLINMFNPINIHEIIFYDSNSVNLTETYDNKIILRPNKDKTFSGSFNLNTVDINKEKLISIDVAEGITEISSNTFKDYKLLKEVKLSSTLIKIGSKAFSGCKSLTKIIFPIGLQTIDDYAFEYCSSLENIYIPDSVTSIGVNAFGDVNSKYLRTTNNQTAYNNQIYINSLCKEFIIPSSITLIDNNCTAFIGNNCSIQKIIIKSDKLTINCPNLFEGCYGFKTVECWSTDFSSFGVAVSFIPKKLILNNRATDIIKNKIITAFGKPPIIHEIVFYGGIDPVINIDTINYDHKIILRPDPNNLPKGKLIKIGTSEKFKQNLIEVEISGVEELENNLFEGCYALKKVKINDVHIVGDNCFKDCYGLHKLDISESVKVIKENAFVNCYGLKFVKCLMTENYGLYSLIGSCVSKLITKEDSPIKHELAQMFGYKYEGYKIIYYSDNTIDLSGIEQDIILKPNKDKTFSGTLTILNSDNKSKRLIELEIAKGFEQIGDLSNCYALRTVKIPSSVTNLQDKLFDGCYSLRNVEYLCVDCTLTKTPFICPNVEKLTLIYGANQANEIITLFNNPSYIADVVNYTTTIDYGTTFKHFIDIRPSDVITIVDTIKKSQTTGGNITDKLISVYIDSITNNLEAGLFENCLYLENVYLSDGIKNIGERVFNNCPSLKNVRFGKYLESIGKYAFAKAQIKNISLPNSITKIGFEAFNDNASCENLFIGSEIATTATDREMFSVMKEDHDIILEDGTEFILPEMFTENIYSKNLYIPRSVNIIADNAFEGCYSLEKIVCLSCGEVSKIYNGSLIMNPKLLVLNNDATTEFKQDIIKMFNYPNEIVEILYYGGSDPVIDFSKSSIGNVKLIPDPTNIPTGKISAIKTTDNLSNRIIEIEIPETISGIENNVFENCSKIRTVKCLMSHNSVEFGVTKSHVHELILNENCDQKEEFKILFGTENYKLCVVNNVDMSKSFNECIDFTTGFKHNTIIKSFNIGGNIQNKLRNINISNTDIIYNDMFKGCMNVKNIKISKSVKTIKDGAFSNCNNVETMECFMINKNDSTTEPFKNFKTKKLILNIEIYNNFELIEYFRNIFNYYDEIEFRHEIVF